MVTGAFVFHAENGPALLSFCTAFIYALPLPPFRPPFDLYRSVACTVCTTHHILDRRVACTVSPPISMLSAVSCATLPAGLLPFLLKDHLTQLSSGRLQ